MRADRLLSILLHLQTNRRVKARELAEKFEISERTILRDLEALSAAGVPIYAVRGNGGGWELMEEYRTNLTGLNEAEAQVLFLSQPAPLLSDLGLRQAAESAVIKLLAALPAMTRHNAEAVRQRIHVDGAGWRQWEEQAPALPALQSALWQDRKVRLIYRRADEAVVDRIVDPLGLVVKGRVWYLVATADREIRTYRVSRVQEAKLTDQPSIRPEGFDLAAHWEQSVVEYKTSIPRYPATLRVDQALLPHIRTAWRYARVEHMDKPDGDGWVKMEITYEGEEDICQNVLGCGPRVEVLEPAALREQVKMLALGVVALYERSDRV